MFQVIAFFTLSISACIASGIFTARWISAGADPGTIFGRILLLALGAFFAVGVPTGTFYSHGLDFYWWYFGFVGGFGVLATSLLVYIAAWLLKRLKT